LSSTVTVNPPCSTTLSPATGTAAGDHVAAVFQLPVATLVCVSAYPVVVTNIATNIVTRITRFLCEGSKDFAFIGMVLFLYYIEKAADTTVSAAVLLNCQVR
jgi:hypothetical protein